MRKFLSTLSTWLLDRLSRHRYFGLEYSQHFFAKGSNWTNKASPKPIAVLWAFNKWKWDTVAAYLPEYRVLMARKRGEWTEKKKLLDRSDGLTFITWGYFNLPEIIPYAKKRGFPVFVMEDGFIRSAELGCKHTEAQSLILDKKGIYFDATRPSELENLLNNYDFSQRADLLDISRKLITVMKTLGVSKYNIGRTTTGVACLGPKNSYRILVLGQLESDASLVYGMASDWSNLKLLQAARKEHPEAEIVYRPHPESLHLQRSDSAGQFEAESPFYKIFSEPIILADLFAEVDHVYTITSLSGFEALLHGIPVTIMGMPFYAGWGLTDDRQHCPRRIRRLCLEELFCGAYLLYPRYAANLESSIIGCLETMIKVVTPRIEASARLGTPLNK